MTDHPQSELPNMPEKPQSELFSKGQDTNNDYFVTCLGLTFESEAERREYFTSLLRENLQDPEFRAIEGFPIGEDDDILALSDPPYYTACTNPWIDDFIVQWESEKLEKPEGWTYHREPYATNVDEGKSHPIYRAHSYHTKVPHRAIMRYILHYTDPGDVIYDGFCGTGMTGVAAQLCGNFDEVNSLGYKVDEDGNIFSPKSDIENDEWENISVFGKRHAILNDLSPIATFIASNLNSKNDIDEFNRYAKKILEEVEVDLGWVYETNHSKTKKGEINYIIWSDVFICPSCSSEIVFWDAAVDPENGNIANEFECPDCDSIVDKDSLEHAWATIFDDVLNESVKQIKRVPVLISYFVGKQRFEKEPDEDDLNLINTIQEYNIKNWVPSSKIPLGVKTAEPLRLNITHVHQFYTRRNLVILSELWKKFDDSDLGKLLLTSIIIKTASLLHNVGFRSGNINLAGALPNALYVPSTIAERNLFILLRNKLSYFCRIDFNKLKNEFVLSTISSDGICNNAKKLATVDYIFIDPPFGSNLNYSELSFIWEAWLKVFTNTQKEAIENPVQGKDAEDYRKIMTRCFGDAFQLLKPGRWMTVEFSNTKAYIWNIIQTAISDAGFIIANVSSLNKGQGTFNSQTNPTSVNQDLVISAYKPNGGFSTRFQKEAQSDKGVWDFVRTHLQYLPVTKTSDGVLQHIPERDPRILYDQVVSYYVRNGYMVPLSSLEFQAGLNQRFAERDGMIFLADQVAEYDRAKLRLGNEIQYSLFVSDESSAIDWLRRFLKEKPQTYQEIQPHFMQEAQRAWKKNEKPIELQTLLEQNFLRYDGEGPVPLQIHSYLSSNWKEYRNLEKDDPELKSKAKDRWYVPDPNQAADIEKLRERSLLREFETYKDGNKRLKLFRLEALWAGFKKAYAEDDYETILNIADRLPHDVLEEDPKLLMWYDLAKTRMED